MSLRATYLATHFNKVHHGPFLSSETTSLCRRVVVQAPLVDHMRRSGSLTIMKKDNQRRHGICLSDISTVHISIGNLGGPMVADDLVRHKVGCGREGGWKIMTMFIFMFMFRKTTNKKKNQKKKKNLRAFLFVLLVHTRDIRRSRRRAWA